MAKKNKEIKLTDQQILFCHEYMKDLNGTQAAIRAGYSKETANEQAARLLANVNVRHVVDELRSNSLQKIDISAERILNELARIAFSDMKGIAQWTER